MSVRQWPASQRPRERLLQSGADQLSDAELLAIMIRTGTRDYDVVTLARSILNRAGGIRLLFDADRDGFCALPGLGPATYAQFQAALELNRRYLAEQLNRVDVADSPRAAANYLRLQLRHRRQEVFACLFLDHRNRVIAFEILFYGTIDGASVHPRIVVEKCLKFNASGVVLAHNHPSGLAEPSAADRQITKRLQNALELIDVRVVDHLIIGDTTFSFAEQALLNP